MHPLAPVVALLAASLTLAPSAFAHGGAGHDHGHAHGGDQVQLVQPGDPRRLILGDWQVDFEATLAADAEMQKAAAADDALAAAREVLGKTRLRFTPDGQATARFPDGRRAGVYTVKPQGDALLITIVDAHDNRLNTADYETTLADGRMTMRHEGTTLVFARPGAQAAAKPALPAKDAAAIVGKWTVDVPRTLSADTRLATMTAEQQKAARDAAQAFLSKISFEWRADGTASISMGGRTQNNRWRLVERTGDRYTLDVQFEDGSAPAGAHETLILQVDGQYMRMTMGPQVLVLARAR